MAKNPPAIWETWVQSLGWEDSPGGRYGNSWRWNSNPLATSCEELTQWKRPWCWERLRAGEGDDRGWDGWMASPTRWTWVWVDSRSWWWTGRPDVLWFMVLQRVGHDWATELNWTELNKTTGRNQWDLGKSKTYQTNLVSLQNTRKIPIFFQNFFIYLFGCSGS